MNTQKQIKKVTDQYKTWLELKNNQDLIAHCETELHKQINSKKSRFVEVAALQLHHMALWHSYYGVSAIQSDDVTGWEHLEKAFYFRWFYYRIDKNYLLRVQEPALILCEAIVRELNYEADFIAQCQIEDLSPTIHPLWSVSPFAIFALELWAKLRERDDVLELLSDVPISKEKQNSRKMYRSILENWNSKVKLEELLIEACNYHLSETTRQSGYAEFYFTPYNLFPVDIMVVNVLRKGLGQDEIVVNHPLMESKLIKSAFQSNFDPKNDPSLLKVIQAAKENGVL